MIEQLKRIFASDDNKAMADLALKAFRWTRRSAAVVAVAYVTGHRDPAGYGVVAIAVLVGVYCLIEALKLKPRIDQRAPLRRAHAVVVHTIRVRQRRLRLNAAH